MRQSFNGKGRKLEEISKNQKSKTEKSKIEKHHYGWAGNGDSLSPGGRSQEAVLPVLAGGSRKKVGRCSGDLVVLLTVVVWVGQAPGQPAPCVQFNKHCTQRAPWPEGSGLSGSGLTGPKGSGLLRGSEITGPKGNGLSVGDLTRPGHKARRILLIRLTFLILLRLLIFF